MARLAGKVVLISGIGRGMGAVAADRFAEQGALVVGGDLDEAAAHGTAKACEQAGHPLGGVSGLDVTDEESVRTWVESAAEHHGRIDVLYNNAGAVRFGRIADQPFADWRFTLSAELDSVFLVTRQAWPHLAESKGSIINVGSTAGMAGSLAVGRVAHTASKGGVIAVTRQLAAEGGPLGIRANSISPGLIETEGTAESLLRPDGPMARAAAHIPLGRFGSAHEVVDVALFLASDESAYVSGANITVDGGWSCVLNAPVAA
jgi:meso-butanediol dehydrogenase / (S,S)-butanediol dehydrogenase / diacetyl reductase